MMTDGIIDSFDGEESDASGDKAIADFIEGIDSINPQEVADKIMEEAYEKRGGKPVDDMMVLVAKVWKRPGV